MANRLGERLVGAGLVTADAVHQALLRQKITGHRLGDCLVDLGLVHETALLHFVASELGTGFVMAEQLAKLEISPALLARIPVRMAEAQLFLPVAFDAEQRLLSVVMADPGNEVLRTEIALVAEADEVSASLGLRGPILAAIRKHYHGDPMAFSGLEEHGARALRARMPPVEPAHKPAPEPAPTRPSAATRGKTPTALRQALLSVRGTVGENDFLETLNILVGLLELQRPERRGHSGHLARQASGLARRMGLSPREVSSIAIAAYLHDLAKQPERHHTLAGNALDPAAKEEAGRLALAPLELFETVELPKLAVTALAQLYEAYDGSGVPKGMKGEAISIGARILSTVDGYLDLTRNPNNGRGRRLNKAEALQHLVQNAGSLYDPQVVELVGWLHSGELLRRRLLRDGRQVVFAEPDAEALRVLSSAASERGLVVHPLGKLDAAVEAVSAAEADVLVVSLGFGLAEVISLLHFVRDEPMLAALPVIVVGEPTGENGRERILGAGASRLLTADADEVAAEAALLEADRASHGGAGRAVSGSFDELSASEVLAVLAEGKKSGLLSVRTGTEEGLLHLEEGRPVFAHFMGQLGPEALESLLNRPDADFTFDPEALLMELPQPQL